MLKVHCKSAFRNLTKFKRQIQKAPVVTYCRKSATLMTVDASNEDHIWHDRPGVFKRKIISKQPESSAADDLLVCHIRI